MRGDRDARDGEPTKEGGDPTGGEAAPKEEPLDVGGGPLPDGNDWAGTGTGTVTAGERRERSEGGLSAEGISR